MSELPRAFVCCKRKDFNHQVMGWVTGKSADFNLVELQNDAPSIIVSREGLNTAARIIEAMESGRSPSFPQMLQLLQEVTSKADSISVNQLGDFISRDLSVLATVLAVANTMGYNPGGVHISTLPQAVQAIGFEKIRNIAIASMLMESAEKCVALSEKQGVAAQALASAAFSQAVFDIRGGGDGEEAFVCAALRGYGEMLMAHYLPEELHAARSLAARLGWEGACRQVMGCTPLELGRHVLAQSGIPKSMLASIRKADRELIQSRNPSGSDLMSIVTEFSNRLCEKLLLEFDPNETLAEAARKLALEYGPALADLDQAAFEKIVHRATRRLGTLAKGAGLNARQTPILDRILGSDAGGKKVPRCRPPGKPAPPKTPAGKMASLGASILSEQAGLREAISKTVALLRRELALDQCAVFLEDEILPTWSAREGHGALFQSIQSQPLLSADARNVFTICLTRGEDVLIENPNDPSIRRYLPEWLRTHVSGSSLLLLSLVDGTGTYGVICGIGEAERSLRLTSELAGPLKELRSALGKIHQQRAQP
ncbi:MAG: HDOD domain-containing protein [Verrucomicrobia bacterium]|nr:HDOD domain-containing protein [Verrucomicrobiota bacterium]